MIPALLGQVRDVWDRLEIAAPAPARFRFVVQSRRRVVVVLFDAARGGPALAVAKISRTPASNAVLVESVHKALQVRGRLEGSLRDTVPAMQLLDPIDGLSLAVEKALPGESLDIVMAAGGRHDLARVWCRAFAEWLGEFRARTQDDVVVISDAYLDTLMAARAAPPDAAMSAADRRAIADSAARLRGLQMPRAWTYGDAHPSNLLLVGHRISGVVDWEGARPRQWAVFDWFSFVLSLAKELLLARHEHDNGADRALAACEMILGPATTSLHRVVQEETARFLRGLDIDADLVAPLFLVFLRTYYHSPNRDHLVRHVVLRLRGGVAA